MPHYTRANILRYSSLPHCRNCARNKRYYPFHVNALARQYRKEMEEEEAEMEEDDAADGVRPKKREDILYFRRTAKEYVDMIPKLNPRQVEAVHELGFGGILDYKIPEIPGEMALWILSVFNRQRCRIQFSEEEFVRITEDDVHLTFGFPKGDGLMDRRTKQTDFTFQEEIARRLKKDKFQCTPKKIAAEMLKDEAGGDVFKKLFIFMMENAVIETPGDGMVKPKILRYIDDVDEIKNYNWCGYLIDVLDYTHAKWTPGASASFTGPLGFLVSLYVDRVVHCRRTVIRAWPTIKGWTTQKLRERQTLEMKAKKFGIGSLEDPLNKEEYLRDEERRKRQKDSKRQSGEGSRKESNKLGEEWLASGARMADSIQDWIHRLKQLPSDLMEENRFRLGAQIGKKLLGVVEQSVSEDVEIEATLTQAKEDEEEYSAQWIADFEKMMQAYDVVKTIDEKPAVHFEDHFRNDGGAGNNNSPVDVRPNNSTEDGPSSPKGAAPKDDNNETVNDQPEHENTKSGEASDKGDGCEAERTEQNNNAAKGKCGDKTSNVQSGASADRGKGVEKPSSDPVNSIEYSTLVSK